MNSRKSNCFSQQPLSAIITLIPIFLAFFSANGMFVLRF